MASFEENALPNELWSHPLRCIAMAESGYPLHRLGSPSYSFAHLDLGYGYAAWLVPKLELVMAQIQVQPTHLAPNKQLLHHLVPVATKLQHLTPRHQ
jgi:hypothetical protein